VGGLAQRRQRVGRTVGEPPAPQRALVCAHAESRVSVRKLPDFRGVSVADTHARGEEAVMW
jgi:hypothetical protein